MKDPAFLFYVGDWMGGTTTMSRHMKGCYIDLLCANFNNGPLSLEEIKTVLGSDFGQSWPTLQKKFKFENGLYFNERLTLEKDKRKTFSESRRKNRTSYVPHMENRNRNENEIKTIYGEFKNVELFNDEYQKLVESLGEKNTKILIAELDRYIAGKGKNPYANHYAVIQTWARRKFTEHKDKLQTKTRTIA